MQCSEEWIEDSAYDELAKLIVARGGMVDCHSHPLTAHTSTKKQRQKLVGATLEDKWREADRMRFAYLETFFVRLDHTIRMRQKQGIHTCRSYIDIGTNIGLQALEIAVEAKKRWAKEGFRLQVAVYPMEGIESARMRNLLQDACEMPEVEAIGCLPSRGRRDVGDWQTSFNAIRYFLEVAYKHQKMLDLQLDQKNHPDEAETYLLVELLRRFRDAGYDRPVAVTHGISMASWKDKKMLTETLKDMARLDISLTVCPGAALNNQQYPDIMVPMHNSIAPWELAHELGVNVALGIDNINDFYMPSCDGDIWKEVKILWDTRRFDGKLEVIADILTVNGHKALGFA